MTSRIAVCASKPDFALRGMGLVGPNEFVVESIINIASNIRPLIETITTINDRIFEGIH